MQARLITDCYKKMSSGDLSCQVTLGSVSSAVNQYSHDWNLKFRFIPVLEFKSTHSVQ